MKKYLYILNNVLWFCIGLSYIFMAIRDQDSFNNPMLETIMLLTIGALIMLGTVVSTVFKEPYIWATLTRHRNNKR